MNQNRTQRIHRGFHRVGAVLAGMILALGLMVVGVIAIEGSDRFRGTSFTVTLQDGSSYTVDHLPKDATEDDALAAVLAENPRLADADDHLKQWFASRDNVFPKSAVVHGPAESLPNVFDQIVDVIANMSASLLAGFAAAAVAVYFLCRTLGWVSLVSCPSNIQVSIAG